MRYRWLLLCCAVLLPGMAAASAGGDAVDPITLRFAHFWPGASGQHREIFQAWADTVEAQSHHRLNVELFPSETLSKADNAYQGVVDGIADITATAPGYTNGRFPLTEVVELPNVSTDARQGACIAQTLYDEGVIADDYRDTHPLFFFTTGPGYLHGRTPIPTPDELAGMRVRRPTAIVGSALRRLGALPVGMPAPDIYTSLQRGVIDAVSFPWEGMKVFRLNEQAHYHTEVPFYTTVFVVTMNQQRYASLPDDLKRVIDRNSGMKWSKRAGQLFHRLDQAGRREAVEAGHHIITVEHPYDDPAWSRPLNATIDHYLAALGERGLPGRAVFDTAMQLHQRCGVSDSTSSGEFSP